MANRDLLKEAIADAKALKETAIANAKAALEEAFEPRLKSMLSAKLQEMEEEVDEAVTNEAKEEVDEMSNPVMRHGEKGDDKEEKRTEKMKYGKDLAEGDDELEEADLDELLAELDNELNENARTDAEEEGYEDGMEDEKEDMKDDMEDEDIDLEEMSEDDLKSFIEDVISDMVEAGELEAGDEFEVEDEETVDENARTDAEEEGYLDGMHDEKEDLDEGALDKLKALYNDKELLSKIITVDGEKVSIKDLLKLAGSGAVAGMKKSGAGHDIGPKEGMEEMDEMKKEIDELKADLHEVNLLNAKLLYTNKIFRAKNLQEAQKVKVLEAFDKASSVKEVKLVFETLNEGIKNTPKTQIKESLGSASKAAGVAPTKTIVEVDSQVARWQKLAGIK
jgi:hypothetical protein